jgi:periplasmic copper chaperone A
MVAALSASIVSYAAGSAGDIEITGVWTRATAPGQEQASVDLTITSKQEAELVGVSSPVAKTSELHSMTTEGGMMRMRQVNSIALPAGKPVSLSEGGFHLMLNDLKAPLKEGETVPLTLSISVGKQGVVKFETNVEVKSLNFTKAKPQDDGQMHMNMKMY